MNMLLDATCEGLEFFSIEIETVYYNQNKSTHFRPIIDASRVYLQGLCEKPTPLEVGWIA